MSVDNYSEERKAKRMKGHPGWDKNKRVVRNKIAYKIISKGQYIFTGNSGLWHYKVKEPVTGRIFTFIPMVGDKIL